MPARVALPSSTRLGKRPMVVLPPRTSFTFNQQANGSDRSRVPSTASDRAIARAEAMSPIFFRSRIPSPTPSCSSTTSSVRALETMSFIDVPAYTSRIPAPTRAVRTPSPRIVSSASSRCSSTTSSIDRAETMSFIAAPRIVSNASSRVSSADAIRNISTSSIRSFSSSSSVDRAETMSFIDAPRIVSNASSRVSSAGVNRQASLASICSFSNTSSIARNENMLFVMPTPPVITVAPVVSRRRLARTPTDGPICIPRTRPRANATVTPSAPAQASDFPTADRLDCSRVSSTASDRAIRRAENMSFVLPTPPFATSNSRAPRVAATRPSAPAPVSPVSSTATNSARTRSPSPPPIGLFMSKVQRLAAMIREEDMLRWARMRRERETRRLGLPVPPNTSRYSEARVEKALGPFKQYCNRTYTEEYHRRAQVKRNPRVFLDEELALRMEWMKGQQEIRAMRRRLEELETQVSSWEAEQYEKMMKICHKDQESNQVSEVALRSCLRKDSQASRNSSAKSVRFAL
ncbi:hypothetical protein MMC25_000180 [Agyrium rufum]|nr:hypothetical protein [Agyrium rufum]